MSLSDDAPDARLAQAVLRTALVAVLATTVAFFTTARLAVVALAFRGLPAIFLASTPDCTSSLAAAFTTAWAAGSVATAKVLKAAGLVAASGGDDDIVQQEFEVSRHIMAELKVFYGPIVLIASAKT